MAKIELKNLRKEYGPIEAVKNLDLVIEDGEFLVLVGPSGCGKTTTLRMIAGFEDPTRGEILMNGELVNELEPGERKLGMVFQSHALFPHKTVAQNIEFGPRMKKMDPAERKKKVEEVSKMVRVSHLLGKLPAECSGGEAQRVALARTLITNPDTYLLDEPLSSLDAKLRRELRAEADRLHQELKKTFVYVTHDQEEAMTLADRIVVMRDGEIEQQGTPMQIYRDPVSYFVADFFGSPSMNLIEGQISSDGGMKKFQFDSFMVNLPDKYAATPDGPATLGIRPEHVGIGTGKFDFEIPIGLFEPMGKETLIYFDYGAERNIIAIIDSAREFNTGDNVGIEFQESSILLFDEAGKRIRGVVSDIQADGAQAALH
ncbi:MAG: ABC transporter ATP-binding protein [Rhizobiaceae bacterium]